MLDINIWSIVFQVLNFALLLFLLSRFLLKPLQRTIAERSEQIESSLDNAAKREAESYATQREIEQRLEEVEKEAEALINQAQDDGRAQSQAIVAEAQQRAEQIMAEAREQAEAERIEGVKQNYEQTLDTIVDLASGILRSVTVRQTHDDLVTNFAAYIWQREPEEVEEYRRALAEREPTVFVYTPVALSENQQTIIRDTLSSLADRRVNLEVQQEPSLIAGLQVRIGDRVVDNSLRRQLEQVRDQVGSQLREQLGIEE
jgi:ATP synthase F0 subunit b